MGGLTARTYQEKGFKDVDSFIDRELRTVLKKMLRDPLREALREALVGADLDQVSTSDELPDLDKYCKLFWNQRVTIYKVRPIKRIETDSGALLILPVM